jgi:hypothetical protein
MKPNQFDWCWAVLFLDGLSANLPLPDYGRVARDSLSIGSKRQWSFQTPGTGLMTRSDGHTSPLPTCAPVEVVNLQGSSASKEAT